MTPKEEALARSVEWAYAAHLPDPEEMLRVLRNDHVGADALWLLTCLDAAYRGRVAGLDVTKNPFIAENISITVNRDHHFSRPSLPAYRRRELAAETVNRALQAVDHPDAAKLINKRFFRHGAAKATQLVTLPPSLLNRLFRDAQVRGASVPTMIRDIVLKHFIENPEDTHANG